MNALKKTALMAIMLLAALSATAADLSTDIISRWHSDDGFIMDEANFDLYLVVRADKIAVLNIYITAEQDGVSLELQAAIPGPWELTGNTFRFTPDYSDISCYLNKLIVNGKQITDPDLLDEIMTNGGFTPENLAEALKEEYTILQLDNISITGDRMTATSNGEPCTFTRKNVTFLR